MSAPGERAAEVMTTSLDGPAPEATIARDLVRRGVIVAPAVAVAFGLIWGWAGVWSTLAALGLVLANFALSAAMLAGAARVSLALVMFAALFGFLIRLGLILAAVLLLAQTDWISWIPFCVTLVGAQLGLLVWETRYVSASLAYPALKPRKAG